MQLFLITHAHTQLQQAQEARQWTLSPAGQQQADTLARLSMWQTVDTLVLSSEAKTRLTVASILAQRQFPVIVDARFDELARPGWIDDYAAQVQRAFAEPTRAAGEWEPAATALARFRAGIADLCAHYADATLALVGHGLTFSLYRAHLLLYPQVRFDDWRQLSFAAVALVNPCTEQLLQDFRPVAGHISRRN